MKINWLLYLLMLTEMAQGQRWLWAKSFGSDKMDYGSQATILKDGNILTMGDFVGLNLYLPDSTIIGNVNRSAFVAKYSQSGDLLNITVCKGAPNGGGDVELGRFAEDEAGNLYMAGSSAGGAWLDTCWIVNGGGGNACIAKFNSDLRCLWVQKHSTGSAFGQALGDAHYYKGNLYNAGFVSGLNNYIDTFYVTNPDGNLKGKSFLCRFDTTSKCIWVRQTWGGFTNIGIAGMHNDKMYCVGSTDSCFIYDTITKCNLNGAMLLQGDTNGKVIWSTLVVGTAVHSISLANNGDFYISGSFGDSVQIGAQKFYKTQAATVDGYLAKFSFSGNLLWFKQIINSNLTYMKGIFTDNDNKTYICGEFIGASNFGNGVTLTSTYSNKYDMFIARYDDNGNCLGAFKQHGVSPSQITQDSAANPIIVGAIYPDSAVLGDIHLVSKGYLDFFIGKLSAIPDTSLHTIKKPDGVLNIYPNPNAGTFTVEVSKEFKSKECRLIIYNLSGELLKDEVRDMSNNKLSVNLGEAVRGIYTVEVRISTLRFTGKVVVE